MISCLLSVLAVLTVRARFDDPDMWLHLKTGQIIWTTHSIPTTDLFSYTTHHQATIPHEWLAQTLIYAAYHFAGYSGLMLWLCLASSALLIAGYALCSLYSGNAKVSFLGGLVIWLYATIGLSVRPQMIGYILLILELTILYLGRTRSPRWFLALPPLFALWVNCHGSFSLGIVLAGILLFSSYFNFQSGLLTAARWEPHRRKMLAVALALSLPALLLNPVGIRLVLYPFHALGSMTVDVGAVSEWQPLQLGDSRAVAMLAILASIVLLVIVRRSEIFLDELLFLAAATWLAASHRRLLFVFGIMAAPVLCRLLSDAWDTYVPERDLPVPNAILIALSLLIVWKAFPGPQNLAQQVGQGSPVRAVEFIKAHHLSGPMLNDWPDGGYLAWAAPEYPVFIDGRGDPFNDAGVTQQFGDWATLRTDPNILLDKYGIAFCLLGRGSPMTYVLPLMPHWKLVYSDSLSVIFVRT